MSVGKAYRYAFRNYRQDLLEQHHVEIGTDHCAEPCWNAIRNSSSSALVDTVSLSSQLGLCSTVVITAVRLHRVIVIRYS